MNKTSNLIKTKAKEIGMPIASLAEQCEVSKAYIYQLLKMGYTSNDELLVRIARVLNISDGEMLECLLSDIGREKTLSYEQAAQKLTVEILGGNH